MSIRRQRAPIACCFSLASNLSGGRLCGMPTVRAAVCAIVAPRNRVAAVCSALAIACGGGSEAPLAPRWSVVAETREAALLSVSGTSSDNVWIAGADDGNGPVVLHWDSTGWTRVPTGTRGDLWWVHAFSESLVFAGGSEGQLLSGTRELLEPVSDPAGGDSYTVFGVWAASETDVYAVGTLSDGRGFVWHDSGSGFVPVSTALGASAAALFKVWGLSSSDVWVVGENGVVLRGNAAAGFETVPSGVDERLFTVHASGGRAVIVGGSANGVALEHDEGGLRFITPPGAAPLQGTCVTESGDVWAVGVGGVAHVRRAGGEEWRDLVPDMPVQSLHAVWIAPDGAAWAVGGNVLTEELNRGVTLRYSSGPPIASFSPNAP